MHDMKGYKRLRLAYLVTLDVSKEKGLLKKILAQLRTWLSDGNGVRLFALSPRGSVWADFQLSGIPTDAFSARSVLGKLSSWRRLVEAINEWCPSSIYHRAGLYHLGFSMIARRIGFSILARGGSGKNNRSQGGASCDLQDTRRGEGTQCIRRVTIPKSQKAALFAHSTPARGRQTPGHQHTSAPWRV